MQQRMDGSAPNAIAFAEFYQYHVSTVLNSIQRSVHAREDAEDVLVEVFLAAHAREAYLTTLDEDAQRAWLQRVAQNKCIDLLRRQQRQATVNLESVLGALYEPEEQSPEHLALHAEEHALLRHHLAALTTQQQVILRLKFGWRLSSVEIARKLNKSESSVSRLLARALDRLRHMYQMKERRSHQ